MEANEVIPDRFCNRWIGGHGYCQAPATVQASPGRGVSVKPQYRCAQHAPTTTPRRCAACGIEVVDHEGTLYLAMLVGDTWSPVVGGETCTRSEQGHR
jgi:hypothetical protein